VDTVSNDVHDDGKRWVDVHLYAVILAGGQGTRLWPRSRKNRPKQFSDVIGHGVTMLQDTVSRLSPTVSLDHVLVVTGSVYAPLVLEQLPGLPQRNVIVEPSGRNTAPAVGLALLHLEALDPDAVMVVLPADHLMADASGFRQALHTASSIARQGYLVTLGIEPKEAHTGYGYIRRGTPIETDDGAVAFRADQFLEKPNRETALEFLREGCYYWNGGIFVSQLKTMRAEMERQLPRLCNALKSIAAALDGSLQDQALQEAWAKVPKISLDYGVMEHAESVAIIPMDVGWNDIGDWAALHSILPSDDKGNIHVMGETLQLDTQGTVICETGERIVVAIGVQDLIIVDDGNVVLVCARDRAQDVKAAVESLQRNGQQQFL